MSKPSNSSALPVHPVDLADMSEAAAAPAAGSAVLAGRLGLLGGVKVQLSASLGRATLSVGELFALRDGSVLKLDKLADEPVDILLDGKVVARGTLVAVDDSFGVSITQAPEAPPL
ncbi:MAG: flagellar motor switch protein [Aquabacterium sp.]|nr:MAG: flagellar motor switch protein [Aquabacterium sp.]